MRDHWKGTVYLITRFICLLLIALFIGCEPAKKEKRSARERIEKNRMNFPDRQKTSLGGFSFQLSALFKKKNGTGMTLSQGAGVYVLEELQCYLIVEPFTQEEVLTYFSQQANSENQLLEIISGYANRSSERSPMISSVVKPVRFGKKGSGWTFSYSQQHTNGEETKSLIAAAWMESKLCLVKLSGPSGIIPFFYDDFLVLLKSIEV